MEVSQTLELLRAPLIAVGLGLLVGLERERSQHAYAGFRTFALVSLLGTVSMMIAQKLGDHGLGALVVVAPMLALTAFALLVRRHKLIGEDADPNMSSGTTTEVALLLVYLLGAYLVVGQAAVAVAAAVISTALLHFKPPMHELAERVSRKDMAALVQFLLVTFVILPILPDQTIDPLEVINPREIWFMVVLIAGMNLAGYLILKLFGQGAGLILGGLLGGLASSTALTASYARKSAREGAVAAPLALGILGASTVVYPRQAIEVAAVSRELLGYLWLPLVILCAQALLAGLGLWWWDRRRDKEEVREEEGQAEEREPGNPVELKAALAFAALYALVKLGVAAAREYLDENWLYAMAMVSGLTDVDAITLSTSQLVESGKLKAQVAWRLVVLAAMSNLVFKTGMVMVLGKGGVRGRIALLFGLNLVVGVILLLAL